MIWLEISFWYPGQRFRSKIRGFKTFFNFNVYLTIFRPNFDRRIWLYYTSKFSAISCIMYSARLKTFDLVHPNFKGTCIEFINVIMQVCWHFKKGLHWNCQGYFWKNSVKCRKQYKAPTNSIRKLTICIDNAMTSQGPVAVHGLTY